jgi:glycosyltransferase involved in cell wall biosynthesis
MTNTDIQVKGRKIRVAHACAIDMTANIGLKAQLLGLKEAGYDVTVVCTPGRHRQALEDDGIKVVPVDIRRSMTPLRDLISLWQLYRSFRKGKFDIVHTHTPKVSLLGQMAARLAGVPVIVDTVHGFYFHDNMKPLKRAFYVLMAKIAAKFSCRILSQSQEDIETAIKLKICPPDMIRKLGNGIDLNQFSRARFEKDLGQKKKNELGIPLDVFVVGIVGRMVREKGYIELFEAVSQLAKKNYNIWLLAIGREEPEKSDGVHTADAEAFGITDRTVFCGHRDDVDELMTAMDVLTLPSYREGYPRTAMEGSAMSLPVVTTDIRGCREIVEHGKTGFIVPVHDALALEHAIKKLIDDEQLRVNMGLAGRCKAESSFDERIVVEIILFEYKQLLEK